MQNKILLIEDDASMLSLLETLMMLEGFEVVTAGGDQNEDLLTRVIVEKPDFILLDVNLSQGSGLELLRAIRSDPTLNQIHVIMSSGIDLQDECLKQGAQGFLLKPYMPDDLITMLNPTRLNNKTYG